VEVARIWIHRGLLHTGDDSEVAGSRLGRSLRLSFEDAGGLFVKLGQAMAQQPQLVTPAVAAELAQLQEGAAPADLDAARNVIEEDLGPLDEVFAEFGSEPLGSASIAQTYLARLRGGGEVVVKVQRPGVAEAIEHDLDILRRQADRFDRRTTWAKSIGLKELVVGFDERTREELDFRIEAANESLAARAAGEEPSVCAGPQMWRRRTRRSRPAPEAPRAASAIAHGQLKPARPRSVGPLQGGAADRQ